MSHNEDFKDTSTIGHLFTAFLVLFAMPLLPMLMGWFTILK